MHSSGTALFAGFIDEMIKRYLLPTRSKGGLISPAIVIPTAKALIDRYPEYNFGHTDLDSSSWSKSLFK